MLDKTTSMIYDKCNECLDNFDFERVADVMEYLNWGWYDELVKEPVVPHVSDIRALARKMLIEALENTFESKEDWFSSTGGLEVHAYMVNDELNCSLKFVLTETETN